MSRLKEYFSKKTDKEIFAILLFFSCLIWMTALAVFRFCGIGYFANEYEEQELVPWVQIKPSPSLPRARSLLLLRLQRLYA